MIGSVGVTGSPGTGKKSVSKLIAEELGFGTTSLNDLAKRLLGPGFEVDTDALGREVGRLGAHDREVYFGHLLPYVFDRKALRRVVVLRCEPGVLKGRLARRGYSGKKLIDNVEAELIGVVSADSYCAFGRGKTFEFDTTYTSPGEAAQAIIETMLGKRVPRQRIDWTENYESGPKLSLLLSNAT